MGRVNVKEKAKGLLLPESSRYIKYLISFKEHAPQDHTTLDVGVRDAQTKDIISDAISWFLGRKGVHEGRAAVEEHKGTEKLIC